MDINDLKMKLEELADSLQFAAMQADQATEELKAVKDVEIALKEAAQLLKEQSINLEARIAKTITKEVLSNLNEFFQNSKKIRESAEAIHQANIQIQQAHQKSCTTRALFTAFLGFIAGAALAYISLFAGF